ncbi:unnamed protein product, partial [marine sediment metagenome]
DTAVPYDSNRYDDYEYDVAAAIHNEAAGWINLGAAWKAGGIWYYSLGYPDRSRGKGMVPYDIKFSYSGALPITPITGGMFHHGVNFDIVSMPFNLTLEKFMLNILLAAVGPVYLHFYVNGLLVQSETLNPVGVGVFLSGVTNLSAPIDILQDDLFYVEIEAAGGNDAMLTNVGYSEGTI